MGGTDRRRCVIAGTARYAPRHPARVLVVPKHHTADKTLPGPAQWKRPVYLFDGWAKIASGLSTSEFSTLLFDIAVSVVFAMPLRERQRRNFILAQGLCQIHGWKAQTVRNRYAMKLAPS